MKGIFLKGKLNALPELFRMYIPCRMATEEKTRCFLAVHSGSESKGKSPANNFVPILINPSLLIGGYSSPKVMIPTKPRDTPPIHQP